MSGVKKVYQIRVAEAGADEVSGNVDFTLSQADLSEAPVLGGPMVDLLRGRSTSNPFRLLCLTDDVLTTSNGRLTELGRLAEIRVSIDGGSFQSLGTGRISSCSEPNGRGQVTVEISDERWVERRSDIFSHTSHVQLDPLGLTVDWLHLREAGTASYVVREVSGDAVKLQPTSRSVAPRVPPAMGRALEADLLPSEDWDVSASNTAGNFRSLRFQESSELRVISFASQIGGQATRQAVLGNLAPEENGTLHEVWVAWSGHSLSEDDPVTGKLVFPNGLETSEWIPYYVGGINGIHPAALLKAILDGDHGGPAQRYDSDAMDALLALSMPRCWLRATGAVKRSAWVEDNLYKALLMAPLVGSDLSLHPVSLRLDQDTDPDTLPLFTASTASLPTWEHIGRDLVNVLRLTTKRVVSFDVGSEDREWPIDRLATEDMPASVIEHDTVETLGEVEHTVKTDLIFRPGIENAVARQLATELFDVFGDGPQRGRGTLPHDTEVEVGDLVRLEQDTLKGFNAETGDRSGERLVRIVSFPRRSPSEVEYEYLDAGPASQPLSAPTVEITQDATDPDKVNVALSDTPSGAHVTMEVKAADSEPTDWSDALRKSNLEDGSHSFRLAASNTDAWVRAYATAPQRMRSAYATDDVSLSTRALLEAIDLTIDSENFQTLNVEANDDTEGFTLERSVHDADESPSFDTPTDHDIDSSPLTIAETVKFLEVLTVRVTPYPTFSGGSVSGTAGPARTLSVQRLIDFDEFISDSGGGGSDVTSVFGRDGDVVADSEDYEDFYAPLSHEHDLSDIEDAAGDGLGSGGNILLGSATEVQSIAHPGTSGQVLYSTGGVGGGYEWDDAPAVGVTGGDGIEVTGSSPSTISVDTYSGTGDGVGQTTIQGGALAVVLGTSAHTAAAGNHDHAGVYSTTGHTHGLGSSDITGTLPVSKGGTGLTTLTSGSLLVGAGTSDIDLLAHPGGVGLMLYSTASGYEWDDAPSTSVTAGDGIEVSGSTVSAHLWGGTTSDRGRTVFQSGQIAVLLGTDAFTAAPGNHGHTFASLSSKPTTIAGYGITDALAYTDTSNNFAERQRFTSPNFREHIRLERSGFATWDIAVSTNQLVFSPEEDASFGTAHRFVINAGSAYVGPRETSGSGHYDLGQSDRRFNRLYLSGLANISGTVSAGGLSTSGILDVSGGSATLPSSTDIGGEQAAAVTVSGSSPSGSPAHVGHLWVVV